MTLSNRWEPFSVPSFWAHLKTQATISIQRKRGGDGLVVGGVEKEGMKVRASTMGTKARPLLTLFTS